MTVDDAQLVLAARSGDEGAFAELVDRWLDRCWDLAWHVLHDRDRASDAAQDALVTAWRRLPELRQPESFGGWVLRITRNRALSILERERRSRPTGDDAVFDRHRSPSPDAGAAHVEAAEHAELVWASAAALGERDASVLDLHLRHGLGPAELAEELDVTPNHAHQLLFRLRGRLGTAIRAWVLWRRGSPRCDELAGALERAAIATFGPEAVRTIDRHARSCPTCEDERAAVVAPAALFAGVPIVSAPADLRGRVISSLADAGSPAGSTPTSLGGPDAGEPRARRTRRRSAAPLVVVAVVVAGALALGADDAQDLAIDRSVAGATDTDPEPPGTPAPTPPTAPPVTTSLEASPPAAPVVVPAAPSATTDDPGAPGPTAAPDQQLTDPTPAAPPPTPPQVPEPPAGTTSTDPAPVPAPPSIDALAVRASSAACPSPRLTSYEISWATTGADSATLETPSAGEQAVAPSGSTQRCELPGSMVTLTATGPGGSTTRSETAPRPTEGTGPGELIAPG